MIPLQTASRHPVTNVAFSPDGSAVAVAQPFHGVTILDRATGRTLALCAMPRRVALTGLAFCGNGKYLAATHAKGLEVFDAATGAVLWQNFHYPESAGRLWVRGDDKVWGGLSPNYMLLRPLLLARAERIKEKHGPNRDWSKFVASSRDASRVLRADENRLFVLNAATQRAVAQAECAAVESPRVASFCPLSRRFAVNDGRTLDVYDLGEVGEECDGPAEAEGESPVAPMPHTLLEPVFTLTPDNPKEVGSWYPPFALLADGRTLLVKRPRNRVQWWDAPSGSVLGEWSWQFEWVTCVAVSADGLTAVAGGRFGRVMLWDLQ
jgi:WD40 repeat protein